MSSSTERAHKWGLGAIALCALIAAGMSWSSNREGNKKDLPTVVEEARRKAAQTPIKVTPGKFADQKRVEAAAATARARGEAELKRRATAVNRESEARGEAQAPDGASEKSIQKKKQVLQGRVVVALSSSMPETMLRDYMRQLDEVPEGIAVLRGFVGGARTVAPTGKWVERVRRKQAQCLECAHYQVEVVVDPLLYRMLDIQKVPAVAYLPGVQDLRHCDAQVLETVTVVYGAASIGSALKRLKRDGVPVPGEVLAKFGGG